MCGRLPGGGHISAGQDLRKRGGRGTGRAIGEEDVVEAERGTQGQGRSPGPHGPCQESAFAPQAVTSFTLDL